jgi:diacylglycerol O-acyltransferase
MSQDAHSGPAPLTSHEALMWTVERDPILRSSFLNLTLLDRAPDYDRFRARMASAIRGLPRLRQRVELAQLPLTPPEWVDDRDFDLGYHLRRVALPAPGSDRQLLDLGAQWLQDPFDPQRPLWQMTVVEGLSGGRAALLAKLHHAVTDGVGGVRLSSSFIDLSRDAPDPEPVSDDGADEPALFESETVRLMGEMRRQLGRVPHAVSGMWSGAVEIASHPQSLGREAADVVESARSVVRQALVTDGARSPLWAGRRSTARHFEILSIDLDEAKRTAGALDGTVNDVFVTGVAGGAAAYHRARGAEADELRISMPVSTRHDRSVGGNSFTPARVLVPAGIVDPLERFRAVHERLATVKAERALGLADALTGVLTGLPGPLLTRLVRQQVQTVDLAASNVRGAPVEIFIAGARVLSNHPMGPTGGTAFNASVLSYCSQLDMGINSDTAAIDDPALLRHCIADSLAEVMAAAPAT